MKAKSIQANSPEKIKAALQKSKADNFNPTLAFVFTSLVQEWQAIQSLLDNENIAVFGATTAGEFTEDGINLAGITLLLLDIDTNHFKVVLKDTGQTSPFEAAAQVAETGLSRFSEPAFILLATLPNTPADDIVKGIMQKAGMDVTIIGGLAGKIENLKGTVFTNKSSSENGILCLVLDKDKVNVTGIAVSGWKPLGTEKKVTKSEGLWVYTIDDEPAMDIMEKYIGIVTVNENDTANIIKLDTQNPLQVNREGSSPALVPTLFFNKENRAVMCGRPLAEGTAFRFSLPPDLDVIDSVVESSKKVKEGTLPEADALVVFSCVGRHETLGPLMSEELDGLYRTWEKPMAGFFSLGEFGSVAGGKPEFHGTTCSWVALKEK